MEWMTPVARLVPPTGTVHLFIHVFLPQPPETCAAPWITHLDVGEAIAAINARFSLSIAEMARILRVSRPTIYAWIEGSSRLKPENRARLARVRDLAASWDAHSRLPMQGFVREAAPGSPSLVDLLSSEAWDESAIRAAFQRLAPLVHARDTSRPPSIREIFVRHGLTPEPVPDHEFRSMTEWYSALGRP